MLHSNRLHRTFTNTVMYDQNGLWEIGNQAGTVYPRPYARRSDTSALAECSADFLRGVDVSGGGAARLCWPAGRARGSSPAQRWQSEAPCSSHRSLPFSATSRKPSSASLVIAPSNWTITPPSSAQPLITPHMSSIMLLLLRRPSICGHLLPLNADNLQQFVACLNVNQISN